MTSEIEAEQGNQLRTLIGLLQGEIAAADDPTTKALLQHETGVLHEQLGEEPLAARDYLAAFNADADFREPLEALVRILSRRRSFKNLGKLLDAMAKSAPTAEERARALRELATTALEQDQNAAEAERLLEEAVTENPDDMAAWLELEMLAAAKDDLPNWMRTVEARLPLVGDATYKALLYIQLAELAARNAEPVRAYEYLDAAAALEGRARFQTRLVLERIAQNAADLEAMARALEGQAELVAEVIDDPERGEEIGVPSFIRTAAYASEAWMRAAEIKRRLGDMDGAAALLAMACRRLPDSPVVARARIQMLELQGDLDQAAAAARTLIDQGALGANAAALWLRVAEAAALASDRTAALDALRHALAADPAAIPARAIELDLLVDGQDPGALAGAIEGAAGTFITDEAKARAFLLAAYIWACVARDAQAAQTALDRAVGLGVSSVSRLRIARLFASVVGDSGAYEAATEQLVTEGAEPAERSSLWFELGRARLLRADATGAEAAFAALSETEGLGLFSRAAWLGRVLSACASGLAQSDDSELTRAPRSPQAMESLAASEADPALARGLRTVAALRASAAGDTAGAKTRLEALLSEEPSDAVAAFFYAELADDEPQKVAEAFSACAAGTSDTELAAELRLESTLLFWRAGQRARAIDEIVAASELIPSAANALWTWARRGLLADTLDARREALLSPPFDGAEPVDALERLGLELAYLTDGGDAAVAIEALAAAEAGPLDGERDDIVLAGALARIATPLDSLHEDVQAALDRLEGRGGEAAIVARAERYRLARDLEQDPPAAVRAARHWAAAERSLVAGLEFLSAAVAAEDRQAEVEARSLLGDVLDGEAGDAMRASAQLVNLLDQPSQLLPLLPVFGPASRLMNLELAPPGCDPRRRAAALHGVEGSLGDDAYFDALLLAGYNDLANGDGEAAIVAFKAVVDGRPDDLAGWEGVRAAAEYLDQPVDMALAAAQLGALCKDDVRGAAYWESAGMTLLERTDAHEDAEIALDRAFSRDPRSLRAFDKLFRRVRGRNDDVRLLTLIDRRLDVAEDESEIAKLFWERARVLQKRGDNDGALAALENVTMLESDHVGALALSGTICIQKGDFAGAAPLMARLSSIKEAPRQERLVSGVTACDLYENKLNQPEKALEVLLALHREGLTTLPVRERLARAAARTGSWAEATSMLQELMKERGEASGRVEAARLAMAIWRDKVKQPENARAAIEQLLKEAPDDPEALELVLQTSFDDAFRSRLLGRGKQVLVERLQSDPCDVDRVSLLARIASAQGDMSLRQAALGVLIALGKPDRGISDELATLDGRVPARPQTILDAQALAEIADPGDTGPIAYLFVAIAETVSSSLGPSLDALNVGRKNRIDPKGGPPLRLAVASWLGALGIEVDFELYVGGPKPLGAHAVLNGDVPAIVLGSEIQVPLDASARSAVAREAFALRRGISVLRTRDDQSVASVVIAACNEIGSNMPNPGYPVYSDISRAVHKEISRKVKKSSVAQAAAVAQSGQDPKAWAALARRSLDRMAAIAAGDVSIVVADILDKDRAELGESVRHNERAVALLRFVLSPGYLELRNKLGMGVQ